MSAARTEARVVVLAGEGKHFSAGHAIGTPERDAHLPFERTAGPWWDHSGRRGAESRFARESEARLGMCRRRRELPKPSLSTSPTRGRCHRAWPRSSSTRATV